MMYLRHWSIGNRGPKGFKEIPFGLLRHQLKSRYQYKRAQRGIEYHRDPLIKGGAFAKEPDTVLEALIYGSLEKPRYQVLTRIHEDAYNWLAANDALHRLLLTSNDEWHRSGDKNVGEHASCSTLSVEKQAFFEWDLDKPPPKDKGVHSNLRFSQEKASSIY